MRVEPVVSLARETTSQRAWTPKPVTLLPRSNHGKKYVPKICASPMTREVIAERFLVADADHREPEVGLDLRGRLGGRRRCDREHDHDGRLHLAFVSRC